MKTTLGPPVTAAISRPFRPMRRHGPGHGVAVVALVALLAATTGVSSSRAVGRGQATGTRHTFLTPATSAETGCSTDSALCLQEGRFLVQATWKKADGSSGAAHAVRLTPESGYFWFLEPDNVELIVKTLDGCSINGRYWFFSGGLTNLEVTITVADMVSGRTTTYSNPLGAAFKPIVDTASLGGCPAAAAAIPTSSPEEPPEVDATALLVAPDVATRSSLVSGCAEGDTALCINGRFQVEATWQSASGKTGSAHAVSLTSESGYFWFFDSSNVELLVKTLDACGIGRGQWFFAAGLTTVGVQLTVTDTFTGVSRNYANPLGDSFLPIQDTSAFSFCPTATPTPTSTSVPTQTPTPTSASTPRSTRTPRPTPTPTPTPIPQVYNVSVGCFNETCVDASGNHHFGILCGFPNPLPPHTIHIRVGDTVTWSWSSRVHSTTSGEPSAPDGEWDSGTQTGPFTFSHTFTRTGTFPYFCSPGHVVPSLDPYANCRSYTSHETGTVVVDP